MEKNECILHGEVLIRKSDIPQDAKRVSVKNGVQIIAPSETTGNHHLLDVTDDVAVYEKDGTLYFRNNSETTVRCVIAERHDSIVIEQGEYVVERQKEYDVFARRMREVRD